VNRGVALTRERTRRSRPARRETELTFLRLVPGHSAVHRLWAGTKLLVAAELALMVSISPTWEMIGVAAAVVALELLVARLPLGAFPRLPTWFFVLFAISGLLSLWSATKPVADVGGIAVSLGGLEQWARFTALALVLAYAFLAYLALPALWTHHEHQKGLADLPMVTRTAQGIPGDPINVGLVGDNRDVLCAMQAAGWYPADPVTLRSSIEIAGSVLLDRPYRDAPVSPLFYLDRREDLAFEKPDGRSADHRHHVRFWKVLDQGQEQRCD